MIKPAVSRDGAVLLSAETESAYTRTGGIDLDAAFRPKFDGALCNQLYCAAISFLLHKLPFVQGITSAHEIGNVVSAAILADLSIETAEPAFAFDKGLLVDAGS
ncbi:MAG: hypothetical protein NT113_06170 [Hyphomicrobiales bacterium]|nr:hypothetical protein [Hyphomicrobiales bacterium]